MIVVHHLCVGVWPGRPALGELFWRHGLAAGQGGQQQEAEGEAGHNSTPLALARRTSSSVTVCRAIFSMVKKLGWQNLRAQA